MVIGLLLVKRKSKSVRRVRAHRGVHVNLVIGLEGDYQLFSF